MDDLGFIETVDRLGERRKSEPSAIAPERRKTDRSPWARLVLDRGRPESSWSISSIPRGGVKLREVPIRAEHQARLNPTLRFNDEGAAAAINRSAFLNPFPVLDQKILCSAEQGIFRLRV
jgi:hypothetical protein